MRTTAVTALLLILGAHAAIADEASDKAAAVKSAETWLALTDGADYAGSWKNAAAFFKASITMEKWIDAATKVRTPLGKVVSRKLKSAMPAKTLPNAPEGSYVVIQYESVFENKATAIETVTPMLDKDGQWRVSGYYIK